MILGNEGTLLRSAAGLSSGTRVSIVAVDGAELLVQALRTNSLGQPLRATCRASDLRLDPEPSEASVNAWIRRGELDARAAAQVGEQVRKGRDDVVGPGGGDPEQLRGIPVVGGRGSLGGAIRGTRP